VPEDEIAGKVLFSIPLLGYLVDFAKQPIGFIVLIGVPAAVIAFDELKKIIVEVQHMRRRRKDQD
jgi:signal peptidase